MKIPSQTWVSPKIEIKKSPLDGKGMFAIKPIKSGEKVLVWGGRWGVDYVDKVNATKAEKEGKLVMQWDENLFSVEEKGDDDTYYINHSCDPNVWMQDTFTLVARTDIKEGEELTADYSLWEADKDFVSKWKCNCGSKLCRGRVTGKDWRIPELQKRYKGHFSPFINKRIKRLLEK